MKDLTWLMAHVQFGAGSERPGNASHSSYRSGIEGLTSLTEPTAKEGGEGHPGELGAPWGHTQSLSHSFVPSD